MNENKVDTDNVQIDIDNNHINTPLEPVKTNKKSYLKIILIVLVILIVVAGATVAYLLFFKPPTPTELYHQSIKNAISSQSNDTYGSFDVNSDSTKVRGEFIGNPGSEEVSMRASLDVSFKQSGVPLDLSTDTIVIGNKGEKDKDNTEHYMKYNSVTTSESDYKQSLESYFSPVINKWYKLDKNENEDEPTSFKSDGQVAAFDALGIFMPIADLSKNDQKIFLDAIDKYNLYQVSDKIEQQKFKGVEFRKVHVTVNKDALLEFENEVSESLSDEAGFKKYDAKFIDELFGKDNKFSADVYFDLKAPKITGIDIAVDLDEPIEEESFNTEVDKVSATVLIEYNRKLTIEKPQNVIPESEIERLLGQ